MTIEYGKQGVRVATSKRKHPTLILGSNHLHLSMHEIGKLFPKRDGIPIVVVKGGIKIYIVLSGGLAPRAEGLGFKLQIGPDHRHAIIRIIGSPHSCFGTIVDVGSARVGHLKKDDHALEFPFRFIRFANEVGLVVASRPDIRVIGERIRFPVVGTVAIYDHGGHAIRIV